MKAIECLVTAILFICVFCAGVLVSPEYISLEESERAGFEAQLQVKDNEYNALNQNWMVYQEECEDYQYTIRAEEEAECDLEKADTAERMAEKNRKLIEVNDGWQDLFEDLNKTISTGLKDINTAIADGGCC